MTLIATTTRSRIRHSPMTHSLSFLLSPRHHNPHRSHSTHSPSPSSFTPLPSHAYHIPTSSTAPPPSEATTSTPANLTPEQRKLLEETIRVDHIGEAAANWIYQATKFVSDLKGDKVISKQVEEMWSTERHHLSTLLLLQKQHRVRPTLLYPVWKALAMGLGAGTALMGKRGIMACTEAVETVIGEHYDDQIKAIAATFPTASTLPPTSPSHSSNPSSPSPSLYPSSPPPNSTPAPVTDTDTTKAHPSIPLLHSVLQEFRDDELEHLDTAVENEAQLTPGHAFLSAVVGGGCRLAIGVAKRI